MPMTSEESEVASPLQSPFDLHLDLHVYLTYMALRAPRGCHFGNQHKEHRCDQGYIFYLNIFSVKDPDIPWLTHGITSQAGKMPDEASVNYRSVIGGTYLVTKTVKLCLIYNFHYYPEIVDQCWSYLANLCQSCKILALSLTRHQSPKHLTVFRG